MTQEYEYPLSPGNRRVQNTIGRHMDALNEALPALRRQSEKTVDALTVARQRSADRENTRHVVRQTLKQTRSKGLA